MNKSLLHKISLLILVSCISSSDSVHAYTIETLDKSENLSEIEAKEDELLKSAQDFIEQSKNKDMFVEYSRAVKIYIDTNIYENKTLSDAIVKDILEEAEYLWEVPIRISDGQYVICTVSRKPPITDEVKQKLLEDKIFTGKELKESEARVGQWIIAQSSYDENSTDYINTINGILNEDYQPNDKTQIYLLGGTPNMRLPFALFKQNGKYKIMIMNTGVSQNNKTAFLYSPRKNLQEKNIYDFETVRDVIKKLPDKSYIYNGGRL